MKVAIYQIIPELDNSRILFNNLDYIKKVHGGVVPAEMYEMVFDGDVNTETIKEIFYIFDVNFPKGYKGRSLSVSDVVELKHCDGKNEFYFCDTIGFEKIRFKKERTMTVVQNHNFDCVHEKKENVIWLMNK